MGAMNGAPQMVRNVAPAISQAPGYGMHSFQSYEIKTPHTRMSPSPPVINLTSTDQTLSPQVMGPTVAGFDMSANLYNFQKTHSNHAPNSMAGLHLIDGSKASTNFIGLSAQTLPSPCLNGASVPPTDPFLLQPPLDGKDSGLWKTEASSNGVVNTDTSKTDYDSQLYDSSTSNLASRLPVYDVNGTFHVTEDQPQSLPSSALLYDTELDGVYERQETKQLVVVNQHTFGVTKTLIRLIDHVYCFKECGQTYELVHRTDRALQWNCEKSKSSQIWLKSLDTAKEPGNVGVKNVVGIVYDVRMADHDDGSRKDGGRLNGDDPELLRRVLEAVLTDDVIKRAEEEGNVIYVPSKLATKQEIDNVHGKGHFDSAATMISDICEGKMSGGDMIANEKSLFATRLAFGSVKVLAERIFDKDDPIESGMALVRPPGHRCCF